MNRVKNVSKAKTGHPCQMPVEVMRNMHLTLPDTWEKLEEDLGRAAERDVVPTGCRYFNAASKCNGCPPYGIVNCDVLRDERAFADIVKRIRKLRGEDK